MKRRNSNQTVSDTNIRSAARKATSIKGVASIAGYHFSSSVGTSTMSRIKNIIGGNCYSELASGARRKMKKSQWTKPQAKNS